MRVAMRYNSYSTPCQLFAYGEVEDYSLNVHCNLVTNTASQGTGSLRWAIGCVSPGETISFTPSLEGDTITLSTTTVVINTPLTIMSDMSDNIWIYGVTAPRAFEISASVTATIHGLRIIGGTNADGSAIRNYGDLTLHSVELFKHPGILDSKPLENPGTLTFQGANTIH